VFVCAVPLRAEDPTGRGIGWSWQNPLPQGNHLRDVTFSSPLIGTAVGDAGTILRTTNGGAVWVEQQSGTNANLWGVTFTDDLTGTAVGEHGVILRTVDGGASWQPQVSTTTAAFRRVRFTDALHGIALEDLGRVFRTTDGGGTWSPLSLSASNGLLGVWFTSAQRGVAVGQYGRILRTVDGGETWSLRPSSTTQHLFAVMFVTETFGLAVGAGGVVLRTTDGGLTWSAFNAGTFLPLLGLSFGDSLRGVAVGVPGVTYVTQDGGETWAPRPSGTSQVLWSASMTDENTGWAVGDDGTILNTIDGGNSWTPQSSGTTNSLNGVSFASLSRGISVGSLGTIVRTTSGGSTWLGAASGTTQTLWGVAMADLNTATAVGTGGVILRSTTGGASWSQQTSGTTVQLFGVAHAGPLHAVAVGSSGTILRTTNGGALWTSQPSGKTQALNAVSMPDASTIFVVGGFGTILRSTDGGSSWAELAAGTTEQLLGVSFATPSTGIVVGSNGTVLRTVNGGASWQEVPSGTFLALNSVSMANSSVATAVGIAGTILRTANGGVSWAGQSSGTINTLASVDLVDANNGWVAGFNGTILHTETGGDPPAPLFGADAPALDFGDVLVGESRTDTITVRNDGSATLLITSVQTTSSRFTVTPLTATLPPGATAVFQTTFTPIVAGLREGAVIFSSNAFGSPDSVVVQGTGVLAGLGRYLTVSPETLAAVSPSNGKFLKPVKRGKRLFPNWANLISETVIQGGFRPWSTESDVAGGMLIGVSSMGQSAPGRWVPHPDSAAVRCWVRLTKWNQHRNYGTGYNTIQRTMLDGVGHHVGRPRGFDSTGTPGEDGRRLLVKQQRKLTPRKHNNAFFAEVVALKLNIAASQLGKTPVGLGELEFDRDGNPCDGHTILQIASMADSMLTYWRNYTPEMYDSIHSAVHAINRAFRGPMDTLSFEADEELILAGSVDLVNVPFLRPSAFPPLQLEPTTRRTEVPEDEMEEDDGVEIASPPAARLYQNYPNPFNPATTIGFRLPEQSVVTLTVYSLLGQRVAELVAGEEFDEGVHTLEFRPDGLATGTYLYELRGEGVESGERVRLAGKLLLVK
jgi:photosystem II stability/assembly factor-like uncharacterized protein